MTDPNTSPLVDELLQCISDGSLSREGAIEWVESRQAMTRELIQMRVPGALRVLKYLEEALEQLPRLMEEVEAKLDFCSSCRQELTFDELRLSEVAGIKQKPLCKTCFRSAR